MIVLFNNNHKKLLIEYITIYSMNNLDKIARQLVRILRHQIVELKLNCDDSGYVKVSDLYKHIPKVTIDDLHKIIDMNTKKRLELKKENNEYYIRAVQGHNSDVGTLLNDEVALEPILEPLKYCIHGTKEAFIDSIKKNGLNRMSRKHIHFVNEIQERKQTSGFKKESDILIFINMQKCMDDGIKFYKSTNNVILTEGIDGIILPKYFKSIEYR